MGLQTLRTRFPKGGAEGHPRVIPLLPEHGADRVNSLLLVIMMLDSFLHPW